ncbi:unnamed protein product [Sphenostylis stenocarpa]|uniref:Uncharacterized protein n=1 Tax=Sphenostylis stenocarpa TaxID=92480 RepID=A0AA86VWP9_9FABA|nr:unnamed protein product [Sphenostylis stenocarpa]
MKGDNHISCEVDKDVLQERNLPSEEVYAETPQIWGHKGETALYEAGRYIDVIYE